MFWTLAPHKSLLRIKLHHRQLLLRRWRSLAKLQRPHKHDYRRAPHGFHSQLYLHLRPNHHLTGITGPVGTSEQYTLGYHSNQPLSSPFSPYPSYGTTTHLVTVSNNIPLTNTFEY